MLTLFCTLLHPSSLAFFTDPPTHHRPNSKEWGSIQMYLKRSGSSSPKAIRKYRNQSNRTPRRPRIISTACQCTLWPAVRITVDSTVEFFEETFSLSSSLEWDSWDSKLLRNSKSQIETHKLKLTNQKNADSLSSPSNSRIQRCPLVARGLAGSVLRGSGDFCVQLPDHHSATGKFSFEQITF